MFASRHNPRLPSVPVAFGRQALVAPGDTNVGSSLVVGSSSGNCLGRRRVRILYRPYSLFQALILRHPLMQNTHHNSQRKRALRRAGITLPRLDILAKLTVFSCRQYPGGDKQPYYCYPECCDHFRPVRPISSASCIMSNTPTIISAVVKLILALLPIIRRYPAICPLAGHDSP